MIGENEILREALSKDTMEAEPKLVCPMVDSYSRKMARMALKKAALGRITDSECEDLILELNQSDGVIEALYSTISYINDGGDDGVLKRVCYRGSDTRKRMARWMLFLKSSLAYEWPAESMPSGILDCYIPTWFDKVLRQDSRVKKRISAFMSHGDYEAWPFLSFDDLASAVK